MVNIEDAYRGQCDNIDDVLRWCEDTYSESFGNYFNDVRELYNRMKSTSQPITDNELESILTMLPLDLFTASETLSRFTLGIEVIKIQIKDKKNQVKKASEATTATKREEEAAESVLGDELLLVAYQSIIDRVNKELAYSRELIMGAKKIWDARRHTDSAMPVSESSVTDNGDELPEVNINFPKKNQSYIKGR